MVFEKAKWITSPLFANEKKITVNAREKDGLKVAVPKKLQNVHTVFSRSFSLEAMDGDAHISVSGDDFYRLYINGKYVGEGPAQGYHTAYYYNRFPVADFLRIGENTITADVYYHGAVSRSYQSADRRMGFIAELVCGNEIKLYTDENWTQYRDERYKKAPAVGYDTLFAENFDYTVRNDAPAPAVVLRDDDYTFAGEAAGVCSYDRYPAEMKKLEKGGAFFDFGQEITGVLSFDYIAPKGGRVDIYLGEETDGNKTLVLWKTRCGCECHDTVNLDKSAGVYRQYDYRAFRYAAVTVTKGAEIRNVHAVVRHYPFDSGHCVLETDNKMLKAVWDICKNGVKYGSQEVFVDCPLREKGQYSGDLTVTGAANCILTGDASLLKKAIENELQSAAVCPGLLCVCPGSHNQEIADYSLQLPIHLLRYYKTTGDRDFLAYALPFVENMLAYFAAFDRGDGLIADVKDKWNLVDWPENLRDGYVFTTKKNAPENTGCHNVLNAFYVGANILTDEIKSILSLPSGGRSEKLKDAFNKEFFDEQTGLYTDCSGCGHHSVHANAMPLYFGLVPEHAVNGVADHIVSRGMKCGVYMAYFLLKGLCRAHREKDALALILDEGTWPKMVRQGATTCFEAWGKEDKWNTSLCHPWASAPVIILTEDILPVLPEYGKVIFRP